MKPSERSRTIVMYTIALRRIRVEVGEIAESFGGVNAVGDLDEATESLLVANSGRNASVCYSSRKARSNAPHRSRREGD